MLGTVSSNGKIDTCPSIVPPEAKHFDHILQRRMMERRLAGREYAFDVSNELTGGAIDFQGLVLRARKIAASVIARKTRVNGFSGAMSRLIRNVPILN